MGVGRKFAMVVLMALMVLPVWARRGPDISLTGRMRLVKTNVPYCKGEYDLFVEVVNRGGSIYMEKPLEITATYYPINVTYRLRMSQAAWTRLKSTGHTWAKAAQCMDAGKYAVEVFLRTGVLYPRDKSFDDDKRVYSFVITPEQYDLRVVDLRKIRYGDRCKVVAVVKTVRGITNGQDVFNAYKNLLDSKATILVGIKKGSQPMSRVSYHFGNIPGYQSLYRTGGEVAFEIPDSDFRGMATVEVSLGMYSVYVKDRLASAPVILSESVIGDNMRRTFTCFPHAGTSSFEKPKQDHYVPKPMWKY